ncbi:MAG: histidine phosphatase family protein [Christensenellaceae bacterium]|jgi:alpha-ribazole phosphatase
MGVNWTLLRHGQTDANWKGVFLGNSDESLNATGVAQIHDAAAMLKKERFDLLLYGPSRRTQQTAQILMKEFPWLDAELDSQIREIDFGLFEGLTASQIEQAYPQDWERYMEDWQTYTFPGGQSIFDYYSNCKNFTDAVRQNHAGKSILIVAHKGFIGCVLSAIRRTGLRSIFDYPLQNGEFISCEQ